MLLSPTRNPQPHAIRSKITVSSFARPRRSASCSSSRYKCSSAQNTQGRLSSPCFASSSVCWCSRTGARLTTTAWPTASGTRLTSLPNTLHNISATVPVSVWLTGIECQWTADLAFNGFGVACRVALDIGLICVHLNTLFFVLSTLLGRQIVADTRWFGIQFKTDLNPLNHDIVFPIARLQVIAKAV